MLLSESILIIDLFTTSLDLELSVAQKCLLLFSVSHRGLQANYTFYKPGCVYKTALWPSQNTLVARL